jgi:ribonuclease E
VAQTVWQPAQAPPVPQTPQPAQSAPAAAFQPPLVIFQPPDISSSAGRRPGAGDGAADKQAPADDRPSDAGEQDDDATAGGSSSRRRRRGGRGKGRSGEDGAEQAADAPADGGDKPAAAEADADGAADADDDEESADGQGTGARRRRRRRRSGHSGDADTPSSDDPPNTVVHVRSPRGASGDDGPDVKGVKGSTRLEAKRQRRREGRESGRRRPPIITESEFLARREAVERVMVVRQHDDRTQIAVLEDGILVEHYVDKASHQSYVGNVYLGRVQNVLPSMEAAFVDIGKGRNAVLYAGEVNFDASGLEGESKRIESALKSGQSILVQATKDPIGHKGARLTSQVSLPGRYLVYVPGASMTGISRKLPDTERTRLKQILKKVMPEDAGVIVRTAAEGATEEELAHDVARLAAQWEAIERKAKSATAPELLYSEPDLTIRVVRDIFNEDFTKLVIASDGDWDMVGEYVRYVAPNLAERLEKWSEDRDVFAAYRVDEQIAKALERKVWLPSGGSLVIDATEAMTVIDVNTGKFTGQGGNLEQTVTRNNLEAAEEIVRQLRVRDVGGIIVIDFIDMVLESNRDLVLRRLLECLARDRTKHQVAEVTSLGLVQMTRKRVGSGLLEAFSVPCEHCNGRGVLVSLEPVDHVPAGDRQSSGGNGKASRGGGKGRGSSGAHPSHVAAAEQSRNAGDGAKAADGATDGSGSGGGEQGNGAADGATAGSRQGSGGRRRRRSSASKAEQAEQAEPNADGQLALDGQQPAGPNGAAASTDPDGAASPAGPDASTPATATQSAHPDASAPVAGAEPSGPGASAPVAGAEPSGPGASAPVAGAEPSEPGASGPVADAQASQPDVSAEVAEHEPHANAYVVSADGQVSQPDVSAPTASTQPSQPDANARPAEHQPPADGNVPAADGQSPQPEASAPAATGPAAEPDGARQDETAQQGGWRGDGQHGGTEQGGTEQGGQQEAQTAAG